MWRQQRTRRWGPLWGLYPARRRETTPDCVCDAYVVRDDITVVSRRGQESIDDTIADKSMMGDYGDTVRQNIREM